MYTYVNNCCCQTGSLVYIYIYIISEIHVCSVCHLSVHEKSKFFYAEDPFLCVQTHVCAQTHLRVFVTLSSS
jgi:hypothetical protein